MARSRAISNVATKEAQRNFLKLSLTGMPSPAIKGTITDPANKTKVFEHLLMPELPPVSPTTAGAERRAEVKWTKKVLFNGLKSLDWKNAEAIEDSDDTIIEMILQCRPNECQAPHEEILRQASDAYWEMQSERTAQKAAALEAKEAEQSFMAKDAEDGCVTIEDGGEAVNITCRTSDSATEASFTDNTNNADHKLAFGRTFSWSDTCRPNGGL